MCNPILYNALNTTGGTKLAHINPEEKALLESKGRFGDTKIAELSAQDRDQLKAMGGAGTTNPETGLEEYHSKWYPHSHWKPPQIKIPLPKVDIKVPTPKEIIKKIDDAYQGTDIDKTLEGYQGMGQGILDVIYSIKDGKPVGKTNEMIEASQVPSQVITDFVDTSSETLNTVTELAIDSLNSSTQAISGLSKAINTKLAKEGRLGGMGSYDETLGDPRLKTRKNRGRRGFEKDIRQGALQIPSSSTGIQIPS